MTTKTKRPYLPVPYLNDDGTDNGARANLVRIQGLRQARTGKKTPLKKLAAEILAKAKS